MPRHDKFFPGVFTHAAEESEPDANRGIACIGLAVGRPFIGYEAACGKRDETRVSRQIFAIAVARHECHFDDVAQAGLHGAAGRGNIARIFSPHAPKGDFHRALERIVRGYEADALAEAFPMRSILLRRVYIRFASGYDDIVEFRCGAQIFIQQPGDSSMAIDRRV